MALAGIPQNLIVQQGNQQVSLSWDIATGAASYIVQRSTDGINYTVVGTPTPNSFVDTTVSLGTMYWYQVASVGTAPTAGQATLTFTGLPVAGESFSVGNVEFTAVTSSPSNVQFQIGSTAAATATNAAAVVSAYAPLQSAILASASSNVVTFQSYSWGTEGNVIQFTSTLSNAVRVGFSGGTSGNVSAYTSPSAVVPAPSAELSLYEIRQRAQQRADRVNSQFVTTEEWNFFINQAMYELYDLLVTSYEDFFLADPVSFTSDGSANYDLPNGTNYSAAKPFYKLVGVDMNLGSTTSPNQNNGYVTVNKYNFIDRNRFVYPNTSSTIYGVFNCQYRVMGNKIRFIPTPSANQMFRMWYVPRLDQMIRDTDLSTIGYSGWLQYAIIRAAKYALDKEESDTSKLDSELLFLKTRIEETSQGRDEGQADTISDVRTGNWSDGWGGGSNGSIGGW